MISAHYRFVIGIFLKQALLERGTIITGRMVAFFSKEIPINPLYIGHEQVLECTSELQGN